MRGRTCCRALMVGASRSVRPWPGHAVMPAGSRSTGSADLRGKLRVAVQLLMHADLVDVCTSVVMAAGHQSCLVFRLCSLVSGSLGRRVLRTLTLHAGVLLMGWRGRAGLSALVISRTARTRPFAGWSAGGADLPPDGQCCARAG